METNDSKECLPVIPWDSTSRTVFLIVIFPKFVLSFLSVLANLLWFFSAWRTRALHFNVRALVCNIALSNSLVVASYTLNCLYAYTGYIMGGQNGWCMWRVYCIILNTPEILGGLAMMGGIVVLGIEQLVATCQHAKYEHKGKTLGTFLFTLSWVPPILTYITGFWRTTAPLYQAYCLSIYPGSSIARAVSTFSLIAVSQGVALLLCSLAYRKARDLLNSYAQNTAHLSLSSRLQLKNNFWTTKTIMPAVSLITTGLIVSMVFEIVTALYIQHHYSLTLILTLSQVFTYTMTALTTFLAAVFCLKKNVLMQREARKLMNKIFKLSLDTKVGVEVDATNAEDRVDHIEQLKDMWA